MKKLLWPSIVIVFVGIIIIFLKYINLFTPGHSVIKKYSYPGNIKELISSVERFSLLDSNVASKITDTTGTPEKGYSYYIDIELKRDGHDFLYTVKCQSNVDVAKTGTAIELIMAYDKINNTGGYNKEAKGVGPLVNYFDDFFITPFRNKQNIKITAD